MEPLRDRTSRLAFQVDKKILSAEEEDYLRVDISAHEYVAVAKRVAKFPFSNVRNFAVTAVVIYLGLFAITNAAAYTKIIIANIQDYRAAQEVVATEDTSFPGVSRTADDPIKITQTVEPDDGVLPLFTDPTTYKDWLEIPSIGVDVNVVEPELGVDALLANDWNVLEDQIRSSLLQGVVHYPGTAYPGGKGNVFLTGHSSNVFWEVSTYNTVFALLPRIEIGSDIYVVHDQNRYHYRVIDKKEVSPKDVSVLQQGDDYHMTLMTCTPIGTTLRRLVVTAELVQ